ncbi:hypothetical protein [Corynebacterium macclintockiae]|uniref:hypothetical protein n=1 Tax=Corynebacterium macclintockiae TaxID=2913501 RepID=UPI003EBBE9F0
MPTSVGDPTAGKRLNIPSLLKDAEIHIDAGKNESRATHGRRASATSRLTP